MTAALFDDGTRGATLSDDSRYRYDLWRRWDDGPLMGWVMLNPSTADAEVDDATIRRCIGYAKQAGLAGIVVRNLYAYRTPKPQVLWKAERAGVDIVGPDNDEWLAKLAADRFGVKVTVGAWGAGAPWDGQRVQQTRLLFGDRLHTLVPVHDDIVAPAWPHPLARIELHLRDTPLVSTQASQRPGP
jgi:hypothetical protein